MTRQQNIDDPTSCWNKAAGDEPIFILKSTDESAPGLVREWALRRRASRGDDKKCVDALAVADAMEVWARKGRAR